MDIFGRLARQAPANLGYLRLQAVALGNLAEAFEEAGFVDRADSEHRRAMAIYESQLVHLKQLDVHDWLQKTIKASYQIALFYSRHHNPGEAQKWLDLAMSIYPPGAAADYMRRELHGAAGMLAECLGQSTPDMEIENMPDDSCYDLARCYDSWEQANGTGSDRAMNRIVLLLRRAISAGHFTQGRITVAAFDRHFAALRRHRPTEFAALRLGAFPNAAPRTRDAQKTP